ncbi:MAG: hypothetical protein PWQ51_808 [Methanolobus sp.]|jgi:cytochrome c biogenesis factor|uniref:Uncharacterized protein n=2 Tax=Methanosarcinaceae TaxID=2206 RepID=W9DQT8_METTI|nr:hypothetical protein MettiDRAFT_2469 [Methanolobus tindarius DSM 2278]MDK2830299.1 hypothetical protein [Methanolobus sp.]MDK2938644.1 hypothetical protein [Methanolobus sp.]
MVGMKYNRYLIIGITLLTVLFLFIFSGAVSVTDTELFNVNGFDAGENGFEVLVLGIGLPLLLAAIYVVFRSKKENSS